MENFIIIGRWVIAGILGFYFVGISLFNWWWLFGGAILRKSVGSSIPIFGGLLGVVAFLVAPHPFFHTYWWIPLLVDIRCLWGMGDLIYAMYLERRERLLKDQDKLPKN